VLVGGARQGQGPQRNAEATYVDKDATIKADALTRGNGGEVVVWSDSYTRFDGTIAAPRRQGGRDGGKVETSSHDVLAVTGRVDAAHPRASREDGCSIRSTSRLRTANNNVSASPNSTRPAAPRRSTPGAISSALNAGTSVTITTGSAGGQRRQHHVRQRRQQSPRRAPTRRP